MSPCDNCADEIRDCFPQYRKGGLLLCVDCAFKLGVVTEKEHLKFITWAPVKRAAVFQGKIYYTSRDGEKFPWEQSSRQIRTGYYYERFRNFVLERDGHRCKKCGSTDKLAVHHITPTKEYCPALYDPENAVTLCNSCHSFIHSKVRKKKA